MLSRTRKILKFFHPEGIPWPGTALYNFISGSRIFQRNYELVAVDILNYCLKGSILDVGTGPGWLLAKLHSKSPELQLTGMDISASMVAKAQKNMKNSGLNGIIEIKKGDGIILPFPDSSFDAVVSTGSIHHWKEPTAVINEVYRVLKNEGYALLYDLVSDTPSSVLKETAREFGSFKMMLMWLHAYEEPFYSHENFTRLAGPTLFRDGQIRFVGVQCCLILRKNCK